MKVEILLAMIVTCFVTIIATLFFADLQVVFEPPYLLQLFLSLISSIAAYTAVRMFLAAGNTSELEQVNEQLRRVIVEHQLTEEGLLAAHHALQTHKIELEMQNEELRRTQDELDRSRARYFDLYDMAPIGYLSLNEQGVVLEANSTAASLLGALRNTLIKRPLTLYILPDDQDIYYRHRKELLDTGTSQSCELRILKMDGGDQFWVQLESVAAPDKEDGALLYKVMMIDITVRKNNDEQLRQALEAAKSGNNTMNRLMRTVAHEFRTPLGLLTGSADILDRYWDRLTFEKRFEQNEHIRSAARQMSNLINSLISFNRMGTDRSWLPPQLLDIWWLCRTIAVEVETAWGAGQECNLRITADCGTALLDEMLLRRVLENLLTNAYRYTAADGTVSLHAWRVERRLCFEVSDSGIGIPEEDQAQIFDPFFRSSNVEERRGLGLGLSIVQESLLQMGGTITVTSNAGEGTTMRVEIPVS